MGLCRLRRLCLGGPMTTTCSEGVFRQTDTCGRDLRSDTERIDHPRNEILARRRQDRPNVTPLSISMKSAQRQMCTADKKKRGL